MAITITSEQIYLAGKTRTTPQSSSGIKYCEAGYAGNSASYRYATLYTCNTTTALSQVTVTARMCGSLGTSVANSKYLGIYVTTTKNDAYLTSSTGGDTKFCFSYTCVDDGTPTQNASSVASNTAIGTVTKNIPAGTFYVYIVPYSASSATTYSTFYSKASTTSPITVTGTEIPIYKATLNNQSATTAGTSAIWYLYNTYINSYYYYTNSTCTTGLASSKITVPAKTGYTFGGYYTSTGGSGTQYITAAGVVNTSLYKVNKSQTLYAKWTGNQYTLVVNPNGGTYNGSTAAYTVATKLQYGATTLRTFGIHAMRDGYTLTGYYTAASGGTKVYNADGTCVPGTAYWDANTKYCYTGNLTVYAQWTANQYTLTVDPNGGTYEGSTEAQALSPKLQYGTDVWNNISIATFPGGALEGYFTAASGGTKVYNADGTCVTGTAYFNSSGLYIYTGNLTVYAQWSQSSGLVYFDNGTTIDAYQLYFDNGVSVDLFNLYFDDGSSIEMCR